MSVEQEQPWWRTRNKRTLPSRVEEGLHILTLPEVRQEAKETATAEEAATTITGTTTEVAEVGTTIPINRRSQVLKEHALT